MRAPTKLPSEAVEAALDTVLRTDTAVRAWAHLDPERSRREAADAEVRGLGPLSGLVMGAKDLFDTADQPTRYGSAVYEGYRPVADAGAVSLLREAGAVCLGKTVTTELGYRAPGPTTNPHRPAHTPGGSSSGSAAAVAAGMVDLALASQTGGSVIVPASYCGVYGFKPTFGTVATSGLKNIAPSLTTVGWMTRDPQLLDDVRSALTGEAEAGRLDRPPKIGLLRTDQWAACDEATRQALVATADIAQALGAEVVDVELPAPMIGLAKQYEVVQAYEAARALAWEHRVKRDRLSGELRELLDYGRSLDARVVQLANAQRSEAAAASGQLFGNCSALLTPAVAGEAPRGLPSSGGGQFARLWSLLGFPAVSIPAAVGATGLPLGAQLVAPGGEDSGLLAVTMWLTGGKSVPPSTTGPAVGILV